MEQQTSRQLAVAAKRGHEGSQYDNACFHKQLRDFSDAAYVLLPVGCREPQITAQTMSDVVTVQYERAAGKLMKPVLHGVRDGGFTRTGQPGEPDDNTTVAVQRFSTGAGDGSVMPDDVGALRLFHGSVMQWSEPHDTGCAGTS
jgi:hypothetical protein